MARRSHPAPHGSGARRAARLLLATAVMGVAVATAPLAAGADEGPVEAPTLAEVLDGEVAGVTATATTIPSGDIGVVVRVTNEGDDPVEVAIPYGTLVVTEAEGDQTLAVTPPTTEEVVEVAAAGGTPTIEFAPGTSSEQLPAYCTELDDGYPYEGEPVTPIDPAHPVLAETLRTAAVAGADHATTQEAVWWLTDEPVMPVPESLRGLLEVDTAAFAAAPHLVTPDTGYIPLWMREEAPSTDGGSPTDPAYDDEEAAAILDESFQGPISPTSGSSDGSGAAGNPLLWVGLLGLVVVAGILIAARAGRGQPTAVPVVARTTPGWYPDPWTRGGHRYWDGERWTTQVMGPR